MPYSRVSFRMTLNDLAKYSRTISFVQSLWDSWASCLTNKRNPKQFHLLVSLRYTTAVWHRVISPNSTYISIQTHVEVITGICISNCYNYELDTTEYNIEIPWILDWSAGNMCWHCLRRTVHMHTSPVNRTGRRLLSFSDHSECGWHGLLLGTE